MKLRTTITLTSMALSLAGCVTAPNDYRVYSRPKPSPECYCNVFAQSPMSPVEEFHHRQREIQKRLSVLQKVMQTLEGHVYRLMHKFDDTQEPEADTRTAPERNRAKYWW